MKMVMMLCKRPFAEERITVNVNGRQYNFAPNRMGHSVCSVRSEDVFTLKNISAAYVEYTAAEGRRSAPKEPVEALPDDPDAEGEGDDDTLEDGEGLIEQHTAAFLSKSPPPKKKE